MPDIIRLLSDHLANQIAAGEVIQRPASAVKELLENAIDAGATDIELHLRDAGKELIQVVDNGKGMSPTDARMAFERHATSKISNIEDLFRIRTMGFRGEALASVAAVAQVELRTRTADSALGTRILIEGTEIKAQEPASTPIGTNLQVKNLFFNVPARRHFLKSNNTEIRHIVDEFTRVAMAQPGIAFRMWHNGTLQQKLDSGNLKQRVVSLLGTTTEKNLVPVEENTDVLQIRGFIGKPAAASRSRGNQFFFINNRFIRNAYLNHAVANAFDGLISKDSNPFYVLFLEVDPKRVDVNVHPTKQEVKFEDDRLMYAYLNAAVKHALARYNIAPSLDFSLDAGIQQMQAVHLPTRESDIKNTQSGYLQHTFANPNEAHKLAPTGDLSRWKDQYRHTTESTPDSAGAYKASFSAQQPGAAQMAMNIPSKNDDSTNTFSSQTLLMVQGAMVVTTVKSGLMLIHLRRAKERIWYERLREQSVDGGEATSQRLLFPSSLELPHADATLVTEALPELRAMGFDIAPFGAGTFVVQGIPPGLPSGDEKGLLEEVAERLRNASSQAATPLEELLALGLARRFSYSDNPAGQDALQALIDQLFATAQPEFTPGGKKIFTILKREEMDKLLG